MKKAVLYTVITLCCIQSHSQELLLKGWVYDAEYQTPVPYVVVYLEGTFYGTKADNVGVFSCAIPDTLRKGRLFCFVEGYESKFIDLQDVDPGWIEVALSLDRSVEKMKALQESLQGRKKRTPFLQRAVQFVMNDWIPLGNPETNAFDFGRIQTMPTYNPIEGLRLRAGIASTSRLSSHFFVKGYVAYGFGDRKFKYRGETIYSLHPKAYHEAEFPKNNLHMVYESDLFSPGEMHPRAENDLLLLTYRRSKDAATYRNFAEINYEREYRNGLSHTFWVRKSHLEPQGALLFALPKVLTVEHEPVLRTSLEGASPPLSPVVTSENDPAIPGHTTYVGSLNTTEVGVLLRYSFKEAYQQQKRKRKPLEMTAPLFFLSHTVGLKKILGGEVSYHRTDFSAQKRFLLGNAGHIDVVGDVMRVWNAVPFPLLVYPNQRYRHHIENNAFFLNRALEFVADEQYTLRMTFVGNDLLLRRIPFLKSLGIGELVAFRTSYGRLSEQNRPEKQRSLFYFPPASFEYGALPYVEGTIGITNILGLLRVEYVHRFTYRHHPEAFLGKIRIDITL